MPVLVFDLDDTLYPELSYVHSGFRAVAEFLSPLLGVPAETLAAGMIAEEGTQGRGQVFDNVLRQHGRWSKTLVAACLRAYRLHRPELALYPDSERCLARFAAWPLYLVTDGHKEVQARKAVALQVAAIVRHAYLTNRYGRHRAKPDPYVFGLICQRERVEPGQVIYVGDNPRKDFVGIKPLGFRTVRILRGNYAHLEADAAHEADRRIHTLDELTVEFVTELLGQ
ncbi:HAD family hydrolase [Hymenobacter sp. BT770]|uniref:HAD family hydrolase n=1 Tax=Hymenobacter sp. BT770 TaxID=2886942 RepID=UPI001D115591|nr:HAD family hydrolase [Hymenobacter sp. BT770]MCC3152199.1 HAD family hydrolase [Hymenobacter sp. BT770]MDO3414013.1 HAD family hydrolase [Hymenobacter sp. BT770]